MRLIRNFLFIFILISPLIFNCCKLTQSEILQEYCKDKNFEINFKNKIVIIFIPVEGCSICIFKSLDFIKNHPEYPFHYIFSSFSKRNMDYILTQFTFPPEKIYFDFENDLMMLKIVNQIPKAYLIDNNNILLSIELGTDKNYQQFIKELNNFFGMA